MKRSKLPAIHGLYAVTPECDDVVDKADLALQGGARILQYRAKTTTSEVKLQTARRLKQLCEKHDALFIINDDVALALHVDADGVHLGKNDADIRNARFQLGDKIIGISCYNKLENAVRAQQDGATYVAFGRFYPSRTKPNAVQAAPELLEKAKETLSVPIVAIGGIDEQNAFELIQRGADAVAVIDGLFGQPDVLATARAISKFF